jgi:hypothetical protein
LQVAIVLAHRDDSTRDRIRHFIDSGHLQYNREGSPHSQNFVVMVVKLAGMIAERWTHDAGKIRELCKELTEEAKDEQPKWWQKDEYGKRMIKSNGHNAVRDCNLYIENFKIKEYIDDVYGAVFYMSSNDNERQMQLQRAIKYGGKDMNMMDGRSNIEVAYQIMLNIPKYYEEAEKAIGSINTGMKAGERITGGGTLDVCVESANNGWRVERDVIAASLIAITGISCSRNKVVGTKLISSMLKTVIDDKVIMTEDTPLRIVKRTVELVDKHNKGSKIRQKLYAQIQEVRSGRVKVLPGRTDKLGDSTVDRITTIDGAKMISEINPPHVHQFGEYPAFEIRGKGYELGTVKVNPNSPKSGIADALHRLMENGPLPWDFFWKNDAWQTNYDMKDETVSAEYEFDSAIIRTKWDNNERYMIARESNGGLTFVNGKECLRMICEQRTPIDLGEVCAVFYRRFAPEPRPKA